MAETDHIESAIFESPQIDAERLSFERGRRRGMADQLHATQEAETMPREITEDAYKRFTWWTMGLIASGIMAGGLWCSSMNASVKVLAVQVEALTERMSAIQASLDDGVSRRYTSDDASRDRAALQAELIAMRESIHKDGDRIAALEVWRAGIDARWPSNGAKP